jgi:hypothetical protein
MNIVLGCMGRTIFIGHLFNPVLGYISRRIKCPFNPMSVVFVQKLQKIITLTLSRSKSDHFLSLRHSKV